MSNEIEPLVAHQVDWSRAPTLEAWLQTAPPSEALNEVLALINAERERAAKLTTERWCGALETADWDGGVFHYEGRIYPWPRGFVPDCPATWAQRLRDMARDVESGGLLAKKTGA